MSFDIRESTLRAKDLIPDGLSHLVKGYIEYAKEVVRDRAIPAIDGFKPSQRRILYGLKYLKKANDLIKSASAVAAAGELHPHGGEIIYDTMTRMVDRSEYVNIPFIMGKGHFGKVYIGDKPAAMRYTEVKLASVSEELFREMQGVEMTLSELGEHLEPVLLPVGFPVILCNPVNGIAVGVSSNIPGFNFHEVNNAVIEYIETGDIKEPLVPDFTTAGFVVKNDKEFKKLMETGKAKIKLRGKWYIDGKKIVITEIPYYTNTRNIIEQIKKNDIKGISRIVDGSNMHGLKLILECTSKKVVDEVLTEVLRQTDLQMTITTNIVVIVDDKPKVIGVKDVIKYWVEFRENVLNKTYSEELEKVKESIKNYEVLVDLLQDDVKRKKFIDLLSESEASAVGFLHEQYPDMNNFNWILSMSLKSLASVDAKKRHLENLRNKKKDIEEKLKNLRKVIVEQLKELNKKYSYPRRTQLTEQDYVFEDKQTVVKPEPVPVVVVVNGKFIKKLHLTPATENIPKSLRCMSDDIITFVDNKGRLLRVDLESIDFVRDTDRGIYLPLYLGCEDDFEIIDYDVIEDKKIAYMYSDGFASVLDLSEWVNPQRVTKITHNGISDKANLIIGRIDLNKMYTMLVTREGRFGFISNQFKHKSRTARTKVINVPDGDEIVVAKSIDYQDVLALVTNPQNYLNKLRKIASEDEFNYGLYERLMNG